jgi:hypothetical protein
MSNLRPDHPDVLKVQEHVDQLSEHFDTVQIFATRCENGTLGGTVNVQVGAGNWFARYGQVQTWLVKENEEHRKSVREDEP